MSSFLLILAAVGVYGVVHSWLASHQAKRLLPLGRSYRLVYNIFAIISFLPVPALLAALPDQRLYAVPLPWSLLMLAGQALAGLVLLLGVLQTGALAFAGLSQLVGPDQADTAPMLVTGGLYAWVRHPLYSAGLVLIWLTPVMTLNLLAFYLGLSLYLLIGARFEERKLLAEFGPAYGDYCRRTPMFIPRPPFRV